MSTSEAERVKFPPHSPLRAEINRRVDDYFVDSGLSRKGDWTLGTKAGLIVTWYWTSYALVMFWAGTWWEVALCATSLGLAMAGIGFAVMHDGNHGASSKRSFWNGLAAYALDMVGGSSYVWGFKHNVIHHQFTNIESVDDDLEAQPFLRMTPVQKRYWYHRFQHIYVWLAYAFLPPKWHLYDDFACQLKGRIGSQSMPRARGWNLFGLIAGKVFALSSMFVVPLLFHPVWAVLAVYAFTSAVVGITLSTVFQLAHCVEGAEFHPHPGGGEKVRQSWVEHQLATTLDFAPDNRLLSTYLGGLNFQIEHHLFPRVSHVHYPALHRIVREVCEEHGVPHRTNPTFSAALRAHLRHLRSMGRPETAHVPAGAVRA